MRSLPTLATLALSSLASAQCPLSELVWPLAELGDLSGSSIALDPDWALIGAPGYSPGGRADLYSWSGLEFVPWANLIVPGGAGMGDFGHAVAISAEHAVVGDPAPAGAGLGGLVHIFSQVSGSWPLAQTLDGLALLPAEDFGWALSLDGTRLAVGAPGSGDEGAVYLYTRMGGSWVLEDSLGALVPGSGDRFGEALSLQGDRLIVGAPGRAVQGQANAGAVYVFARIGGTWTQTDFVLAPTAVARPGRFGAALDLDGDRFAVGEAHGAAPELQAQVGRVHLFELVGAAWAPTALVRGSLPGVDLGWGERDAFGQSLDLDGDDLLVGAPSARDGGLALGATYLFRRSAGQWLETRSLLMPDSNAGHGSAVALEGSQILVGAPYGSGSLEAGVSWFVDRDYQGGVRPYCDTAPNSVGPGARIDLLGPLSLSANHLRLRAEGLPPHSPAFFFYGSHSSATPFFGGTLCVRAPHMRFLVDQSNAAGVARHEIDLNARPTGSGPGRIESFSTWFFQLAYSDSGSLRTSDAIAVTFCL